MGCWTYRDYSLGPRRRSSVPAPDLRVSDAERTQVGDLLARHFSDGRLDRIEFDERMSKAMGAKTRADLAGLLTDLPQLDEEPPGDRPVPHRHRGRLALLFVTALIFLAAFSSAAWTWHFPWLLFAVIFFVFWSRTRRGWHRHRVRDWI
ncbi:MAG: DUF1707 SHOCT-like domain-containing protein [Acidimicrobiales bacterium]